MPEENTGAASAASPPFSTPKTRTGKPAWVDRASRRFEKPSARKAAWQLSNTLIPYPRCSSLMYLTMMWHLPYIVTLLIALPASALLVRVFIFFHDCSHGSYVASPSGRRSSGTSWACSPSPVTPTGAVPTASITPPRATWTGAASGTCGP